MVVIEKPMRRKYAYRILKMVRAGARRKETMLAISVDIRRPDLNFKCTTRTLYRWLKEFRITLPR